MTLLHELNRLTAAQVAQEMNRLLADPKHDSTALPYLYRLAVENLKRKESENG